ncbi:MAG: glyoxalase [Dehalococcoidia bacterium]|nr:glyoxalase [Dehalococcoidia bacterium]
MIFVNLAVENAAATRRFFEGLGFTFNEQFRDEHSESMRVNDQAFAMFLEREKFQGFTKKELTNPRTQVEVLVALSCPSREAVDAMVSGALASGGGPAMPAQDYGFMYSSSFEDLDGHVWEVMWMDPAHVQS